MIQLRASPALLPLWVAIFVTALLWGFRDRFGFDHEAIQSARWTTEITEMYIALWALAYVAMKLGGTARRRG